MPFSISHLHERGVQEPTEVSQQSLGKFSIRVCSGKDTEQLSPAQEGWIRDLIRQQTNADVQD